MYMLMPYTALVMATAAAQLDISSEQSSHLPSLDAGATAASTPSGCTPFPTAPAHDVMLKPVLI
jgi:hypothetical protein